jgi:hypothetical protein
MVAPNKTHCPDAQQLIKLKTEILRWRSRMTGAKTNHWAMAFAEVTIANESPLGNIPLTTIVTAM